MSVNSETFELGFVQMVSATKAAELGVKQEIDKENGVILGAQVTMKGEAEGHGLMLDDKFLNRVVKLGNENVEGVKMRAGHPEFFGKDAIGSFLGVRKNFARKGDFVFADMFFSKAANQEMKDHIFTMAEEHPTMLGSSVVVRGRLSEGEKEDDPPTLVLDSLHAVDVVDEPAAGTGMFSKMAKQLLNNEQETQEVNSMEQANEELATKKAELLEEQLAARDVALETVQAELAELKRAKLIGEVKAEVKATLADSGLCEAAQAKLQEQYEDAESIDGLGDDIAELAAFIEKVQKPEDDDEDGEVTGMGIDSQTNSDTDELGHDGRIKALRAKNPDLSYSAAYKITMTEEEM